MGSVVPNIHVVYSIKVENDTFSKPSIQEAEYITPYIR